MASKFIQHLSVEGVLVPQAQPMPVCFGDRQLADRPHALQLAAMLSGAERVRVVINSAWVLVPGIRGVLDMFPAALRLRVIGVTVPGNRLQPHHCLVGSARESTWPTNDVNQRTPAQIAVLESDTRNVPVPLPNRTTIISEGLWAASHDDWSGLRQIPACEDEVTRVAACRKL